MGAEPTAAGTNGTAPGFLVELRKHHSTVRAELVETFGRVLAEAVSGAKLPETERLLAFYGYPKRPAYFAPLGDLSESIKKEGGSEDADNPVAAWLSCIDPADYAVAAQDFYKLRYVKTAPPPLRFDRRSHILPPVTKDDLLRVQRNVPQELLDLPIWVAASRRAEFNKKVGARKTRKEPINPKTGALARNDDPTTWGSLADAIELARRGPVNYAGIGVNLLGGEWMFLDIDNAIGPDGRMRPEVYEFIKKLSPTTFIERSVSGTGLHVAFRGAKPDWLQISSLPHALGEANLEVYDGSKARYILLTGDTTTEGPMPIQPLCEEDLDALKEIVDAFRAKRASRVLSKVDGEYLAQDGSKLMAALAVIDATDYHDWIEVGIALKHALGDPGLEVWRKWSATSSAYDADAIGANAIDAKWKTFGEHSNPAGLGKIYFLADQFSTTWKQEFNVEQAKDVFGAVPLDEQPEVPVTGQPQANSEPAVLVKAPAPAPVPEKAKAAAKPARPQIQLREGAQMENTKAAEDALLKAKDLEPIYRRGTGLVRIVRLRERVELLPGTEIPAHMPMILPVQATWLRALFERAADFVKFDGRSKKLVRKDCPPAIADLYLQMPDMWRVPQLTAVVTSPMLRADGSVLQTPGYDAATGIVFDPCGVAFPLVPDAPTLDDAKAAITAVLEPMAHYKWAAPHDRSVWLASVLTAIVRASLSAAPAFLTDSPTRGSGKTKADIAAAIIATGTEPAIVVHVADDTEQKKRLFALLMRGVPTILIDNVDTPLEGASLNAMLSSPVLEDRVLGQSRVLRVSTSTTMFATGNNLHVRGDLTRRVLVARIDPQVERPEEREFPFEPVAYARQHRPRLAVAALTILRAFEVAGRPAMSLQPFGGFEDWSQRVRAALVWAGEPDPVLGRQGVEEVDDDHAAFAALLKAWHRVHGDRALILREAMTTGISPMNGETVIGGDDSRQRAYSELRQAFEAIGGDDPRHRAQRVGERLAAERDRVFDGLRFVMLEKTRDGIRKWRVEAAPGAKQAVEDLLS